MYLTQINMIRGLTKAECFQLSELCFFSNCLCNFALYNVRQKFFNDKIDRAAKPNLHKIFERTQNFWRICSEQQ